MAAPPGAGGARCAGAGPARRGSECAGAGAPRAGAGRDDGGAQPAAARALGTAAPRALPARGPQRRPGTAATPGDTRGDSLRGVAGRLSCGHPGCDTWVTPGHLWGIGWGDSAGGAWGEITCRTPGKSHQGDTLGAGSAAGGEHLRDRGCLTCGSRAALAAGPGGPWWGCAGVRQAGPPGGCSDPRGFVSCLLIRVLPAQNPDITITDNVLHFRGTGSVGGSQPGPHPGVSQLSPSWVPISPGATVLGMFRSATVPPTALCVPALVTTTGPILSNKKTPTSPYLNTSGISIYPSHPRPAKPRR